MTPAIAGISGGRTSARMAYMLPDDVVLTFQNTGREARKTYDFIAALEQDLDRPIVRLEYRAPPRGDAPRFSTFEIVEHRHLSRRGEPFRDLLVCLATYRAKHKSEGPIAPWARSRVCTAYLKVRTQRKFCVSLGWGPPTDYTEYVGLRADEPGRVAKMRGRNEARNTDERAPLFDAGISKSDVLEFWSRKPFDLGLPEWLGNCTGCFLKDESDLATALLEEETDPQWWIGIEDDFAPMRRGRSSYQQVLEEAPERMRIRAAVERGDALIPATRLLPRRHKLILAQELDRYRNGPSPFACECDAAKADDFDEAA
ncbi:MAG: hypothetical protein ACM358_04970 [Gemmatimonadota bacterium]